MQPQDDREDLMDRPLWDLLDRVPSRQVRGNFADGVLRRIRHEVGQETEVSFGNWWVRSWKTLAGLTGGAALLVSAFVFQENHFASTAIADDEAPELSTLIASVSLNELADLDTSLDDNDVWLGTASY